MTPSANTPKWNALANFIGLGYATVIGLAILPLYLQYLGAEAFGLVGFFSDLAGLDAHIRPGNVAITGATDGTGAQQMPISLSCASCSEAWKLSW